MTVIFLSNIGKNIPELATPYIKAFITKVKYFIILNISKWNPKLPKKLNMHLN